MNQNESNKTDLNHVKRLELALNYFNSANWYLAHDILEELWHETLPPERTTLQGLLQVAVAQLHLERENFNGAILLYGEALGRLRSPGIPNLQLDIEYLCGWLEDRLTKLQDRAEGNFFEMPVLRRINDSDY